MNPHTDPDSADSFSGAGILEDSYDEGSWADASPWDEPGDERLDHDEEGSAKKHGETSYCEGQGEPADLSDDFNALTSEIRRLQDATSFRAGVRLKGREWGDWDDEPKQPRIEVWWLKVTDGMDAEAWANLPESSPLLDRPFPWERGSLLDQTQAEPLGMDPGWATASAIVGKE